MSENPHTDASVNTKITIGNALQLGEVHRDPVEDWERYFVAAGKVAAGVLGLPESENKHDVVVKDVKHGLSPENLINDITFLRLLNKQAPQIAPRLYASNTVKEPWLVQESLHIGSVAEPGSRFFFNPDRLTLKNTPPKKIFDAIATLQALSDSPELPDHIAHQKDQPSTAYSGDREYKHLSEASGRPLEEVEGTYELARRIRDNQPKRLTHGEVYPPHIFVADGAKTAKFIDWENARMDSPYTDHVAVWLRSFENPEWQQAYYDLVSSLPGFSPEAWIAEVHLAAVGNTFYFDDGWSDCEPADRRQVAREYCYNLALQTGEQLREISRQN